MFSELFCKLLTKYATSQINTSHHCQDLPLQIAKCGKDLSKEKDYYQRYRVCEEHLNLSALRLADGQEHRFCQQCGRFHPLLEFDGEKK